jgi:hypothetical protein
VAQELLPAQHLPRVPEEDLGERELARAQVDRLPVHHRLPCTEIEGRIAGVQDGRLGRALTPQPEPHARQELLEAERLRDVVVGAALEPRDGVADRVARGQDHDGERLVRATELAQDVEAVEPRKPEVEHEQVELAAPGQPQRVLAVRGDLGREAVRAKALLHEGRDPRLVLGDQDPAHAPASPCSG